MRFKGGCVFPCRENPELGKIMNMPKIQTSLLEIAYRDDGPRDGPVVLLLHGWPDDSPTWDAIIPALNDAGLRTIAPMMRGFGATRFLSRSIAWRLHSKIPTGSM
jgi:pimeloyl-ACP methyl ester carboxylesterase